MTTPYTKGGCLLCGTMRKLADIKASRNSYYFTDDKGSKTKIGFCPTCADLGTYDYEQIKMLLCASEKAFAFEKGRPSKMTYWCGVEFVAHEPVSEVA